MSADPLPAFAYGEQLDTLTQRSLGFRLLIPSQFHPLSGEIEALARRLQAAPYPETWPAADLFCSVILSDGRRLVALARYGLVDHTPSQRRGGLELLGFVVPPELSVGECLGIYRWVQRKRLSSDGVEFLGAPVSLDWLRSESPEAPAHPDPVPVLPIRLWQEGAVLFAATGPLDADHNLRLLEESPGRQWQWLPLVGSDFPLATFSQRGPVVAWTPHLAGIAVKLDPTTVDSRRPIAPVPAPARPRSKLGMVLQGFLVLLLVANLAVSLLILFGLFPDGPLGVLNRLAGRPTTAVSTQESSRQKPEEIRAEFADALYEFIADQGQRNQWNKMQAKLVARYDRIAITHPNLRVKESDAQAKAAVGAVSLLSGRNPDRLEEVVRQALFNRGFSDKLIKAACEHVREQFAAEAVDYP